MMDMKDHSMMNIPAQVEYGVQLQKELNAMVSIKKIHNYILPLSKQNLMAS